MSRPAVSAEVIEQARAQWRQRWGDALRTESRAEVLSQFSRDESGLAGQPPQLVVFAQSTAQVRDVLETAKALGLPVTPVGARTGKSGGSIPASGGIALSLEKMNQIIRVDANDLTATVQPGVVLADLQREVERQGLFYPPDPNSAASCTVGGTVAENAGGPRALKYGVTRDYVLGLEWVFPDGQVERLGRRTSKGVAGYDLVSLCVGSEGTLGIATEITVKLLPRPRAVLTALAQFGSVEAAAKAVTAVLHAGLLPRALELLDDVALEAVQGRGLPIDAGSRAVVLIELDGFSQGALLEEMSAVQHAVSAFASQALTIAADEDQRQRLWQVRAQVSPALRELKKFKLSEDVVVPRSRLVEAIARFKNAGSAEGLTVATYGHAGDGNLHANVLFSGPAEQPRVDRVMTQLMSITLELGGTITGEHGVGLAKREFLEREQSESLIGFQRALKRLVDPAGLFNPGKIFVPR